jgi:tetratricopeptide (TPR) repeat protein
MENYEQAIENYQLFISKVYDQELKHSAYGDLGYCMANTGKYQEAIPFLTRYLEYFNHSEVTPITLAKLNTGNQNVGKYLIQRGFCRTKLEDFEAAERDLTKGINFMEMVIKSPKYKEDWNYHTLGFGYLMRGLAKMQMNKGKIFCEDLRKSIDYGFTPGIELVKNYCN